MAVDSFECVDAASCRRNDLNYETGTYVRYNEHVDAARIVPGFRFLVDSDIDSANITDVSLDLTVALWGEWSFNGTAKVEDTEATAAWANNSTNRPYVRFDNATGATATDISGTWPATNSSISITLEAQDVVDVIDGNGDHSTTGTYIGVILEPDVAAYNEIRIHSDTASTAAYRPQLTVTTSTSLNGSASPSPATVTTATPDPNTSPVTVFPDAASVDLDVPYSGPPTMATPDAATASVSVPRPSISTTGGFSAMSGVAGASYTAYWPTAEHAVVDMPVAHWVHGGSFTSGTRALSDGNENATPESWTAHLRSEGFLVVTSDYQESTVTLNGFDYLCNGPTHPVAIKTVKTHILEVQSDLGVTPNFYFLAAHSAGTQIALMAALTIGDTDDYVGYQNNNFYSLAGTTEGRDGWYGGAFSAYAQTYDYNYLTWNDGVGTSPDKALTTGDDANPVRGVFCYAPVWNLSDAQDEGADQRRVLRNYFGQTVTAPGEGQAAVVALNFEGDPDDYVAPVSGSVHHDVRGTTKRLPTTVGYGGFALAFAAAYSSSDTTIPPDYGVTGMVSRFNTEGIGVDASVNTMSSAGEAVLDAADVTLSGLTRIELPSGTAHEDVTFDSAPEDFVTWANEIGPLNAEIDYPGETLAVLTVPTPTISISANVTPDAVTVDVVAPSDTLGGLSGDATPDAATVTFTVGDSGGSASAELAEPDAVPVTFTVPAAGASADGAVTVDVIAADVTVPALTVTVDSNVTADAASVDLVMPSVSTAVGVAPDPVTVTVAVPDATAGVSDAADGEAGTVTVTVPDATAVGTFGAQPDAATVSTTVPTATASPGGGAVPDSATFTVTVPAVTVTDQHNVTPDAVAVTVTASDATVTHTGSVSPNAVTLAATVPTPDIGIGASVTAGVEVVVFVSPAVTAQATGSAPGEAATVSLGVPAPTVSVGETVTPDAATVTVTAPAAAGDGGAGVSVSPATVTVTAPDAAALRVDADGEAATLALEVPAPSISTTAEVIVAAIVWSVLAGSPTVSTGATTLRVRGSRRRSDFSVAHRRPDFTQGNRRQST